MNALHRLAVFGVAALAITSSSSRAADAPEIAVLEKLEGSSKGVALLDIKQQRLDQVLEEFGMDYGFEVRWLEGAPKSLKVTVKYEKMTTRQMLEQLASEYGLSYDVPRSHTLVVGRAVPAPEKPSPTPSAPAAPSAPPEPPAPQP